MLDKTTKQTEELKAKAEAAKLPAADPKAADQPQAAWKVQLKHSVRGMSYRDGERQLSPELPAGPPEILGPEPDALRTGR